MGINGQGTIVPWTKFRRALAGIVVILVTITSGCSILIGDATRLPDPEKNKDRTMLEIYRGALQAPAPAAGATSAPGAGTQPARVARLCEQLRLELKKSVFYKNIRKRTDVICRKAEADSLEQRKRAALADELSYVEYTREADTEMKVLFPRLKNPDLVVYVYPHLSTKMRVPIPGYTTVIPLYEKVEFRLPGEKELDTPYPVLPIKKPKRP